MHRVAVLGAGSWGCALTTLLPAPLEIALWSYNNEIVDEINSVHANSRYLPTAVLHNNVRASTSLSDVLIGAEAVIFAIPSSAIREVAFAGAKHIAPNALIISASKGLEDETGMRMSEVITNVMTQVSSIPATEIQENLVALSGPNLALEIANRVPTASVAASTNLDAANRTCSLLMGDTFRVYTSTDIIGVEIAGAVKNIIAIGAGVCEGIGFGDNSKAALLTRGLAEITRLGSALGAEPATFMGLSGVGDLIATCSSRLSRNYRVGIGLGEGNSLEEILAGIGQVAEGVPTTQAVYNLAHRLNIEMPICNALHGALFEGKAVRDTITMLMQRPAKMENELHV